MIREAKHREESVTLLLESDLSSYSDEAYEADLCLLPQQRREKAMNYRFLADRKRSVKAYMLLWDGLRQDFDLTEAPVFCFEEHGKPFLRDHPEIYFNLSHTGNAVLCALGRQPVGVDIEMIERGGYERLLSVFSDAEQAEITQAEHPEIRFTELWTRKESFIKLTGDGLVSTRALREIPTQDTDSVHFETVVREADGFAYSWCQWKPDKP